MAYTHYATNKPERYDYLYHPHAARRAVQTVPKAKLVVLLRNPVDRAYSSYLHVKRLQREPLSTFEEAIDAEPVRIEGEREKMLADEWYASVNHRLFSYLSRGIYIDQIVEWRQYFSENQMLVLKTEDLFQHEQEILNLILKFLELPEWEPEGSPRSRSRHRKHPPMNPIIRKRLERFFEPHNRRLYDYLNRDFGW